MFRNCTSLTSIGGIDFSKASSTITNIFYNCTALTSVKVNGIITKSIDISGAKNLDETSLINFCEAL
jgi:hypothetical protein